MGEVRSALPYERLQDGMRANLKNGNPIGECSTSLLEEHTVAVAMNLEDTQLNILVLLQLRGTHNNYSA